MQKNDGVRRALSFTEKFGRISRIACCRILRFWKWRRRNAGKGANQRSRRWFLARTFSSTNSKPVAITDMREQNNRPNGTEVDETDESKTIQEPCFLTRRRGRPIVSCTRST